MGKNKDKKWILFGILALVIVAAGILGYLGIRSFIRSSRAPEDVLGDPILEIQDADVALAELPDLEEMSVVREYSLQVIDLINAERAKAGVGALVESDALYAAASLRSEELVQLFSHNRPDGSLCFTVYGEFNISCRARAENIAAGQSSPEKVVEAWMKSDGHSRNILNPSYGKVGVGVYQDSSGKIYWVQLFSD